MNGGSNQRSHEGSEMDLIYIAIGILAGIAVLLYFFHDQILTGLLWIKYLELKLISFFMPNTNFRGLENWVQLTQVQRVTYSQLAMLSNEIGETIRIPCAVISAILGVILYIFHPQRLYTYKESTHSLAEKVGQIFPAIKVVDELDLIKMPIDSGPWAMAETPVEFAKRHKLIHRHEETGQLAINRMRAKMVFNQQLGPRWKGIESLKPYERTIFAILAAFINYKREDGDAALERIATSVKKKNLASGDHDFTGISALMKKYGQSPQVMQIVQNHAYKLTVFTEMLAQARKSGIVANSLFLWLKPLDRRLWYTLNNVGRKAVFTEAGAVHAHWLAETSVGYAVAEPMTSTAIDGLEQTLAIRIIEHHELEEKPTENETKKKAKKKKDTQKPKAKTKAKASESTTKKTTSKKKPTKPKSGS